MRLAISTPGLFQWVDLTEGTLVLGRSGSCSVTLSDPILSRQHCAITREGTRVTCSDLGSSNGTYLDGALIERADLVHGSVIEIGESAVLLVLPTEELPGDQLSRGSFRNPDRIKALMEDLSNDPPDPSGLETVPIGLVVDNQDLVDEVIVDHVINELLKILTHQDPGFRDLLTRSIDRALGDRILETCASPNELRSRIREILEKERT
ncbi:MAG: hypothetical protein CBC13_04465 [Planctomycetia bacterium TMED53]|nr:MAG: hypothetical protein CBC13_04465 [Planctomycetia bacterium TMED53]